MKYFIFAVDYFVWTLAIPLFFADGYVIVAAWSVMGLASMIIARKYYSNALWIFAGLFYFIAFYSIFFFNLMTGEKLFDRLFSTGVFIVSNHKWNN